MSSHPRPKGFPRVVQVRLTQGLADTTHQPSALQSSALRRSRGQGLEGVAKEILLTRQARDWLGSERNGVLSRVHLLGVKRIR